MGKKYKKTLKSKNKINFNCSNFNSNNYYLFNVTRYKNLLNGIKNLNDIKPNKTEINIIKNEIELCKNVNVKNLNPKVILVNQEFYSSIKTMKKNNLQNSDYGKEIKFILDYLKNKKDRITLKKISEKYYYFYKKKISICTVSRVLKNHLNIRFLKTCIKNPKLDELNYLIMSFVYLRCFIRSLILKLNIIFIDESGFLIQNNNYHCWRSVEGEIHDGPKNRIKERINLILAVSSKNVVAQKFVKGSVNSQIFINFLSIIIKNMNEDEKKNTIIIMDNASYHLSSEVINFFKNEKLKGLTNCPYRSNFNCIELVFRFIKNIIYKNVYSRIEDLKADVDKILKSENLKKSLMHLYKETLEKYIIFIEKYNNYELKELEE